MKKIILILSVIGLVTLSSCGAQEDCRGRGDNYKIQKQQPTKMLAAAVVSIKNLS